MDESVPVAERPRSHRRKPDEPKQEDTKPLPTLGPSPEGLLLDLAAGMFTAAWGEEARFSQSERQMIQPPLGRMLARMSPGDAAKFAAFADPVFLMSGLLVWGMRVWTLNQRKVTERARSDPQPITPGVPVVQGVPVNRIPTEHRSREPNQNGTASAEIREAWGTI